MPSVRAALLSDQQYEERCRRMFEVMHLVHLGVGRKSRFSCLEVWFFCFCICSEVIRNDTLREQRHTIPKECRRQIRAQLFQQRENIDFDPKLKNACRNEIKEICATTSNGGGQVNSKNASDSSYRNGRQTIGHFRSFLLFDRMNSSQFDRRFANLLFFVPSKFRAGSRMPANELRAAGRRMQACDFQHKKIRTLGQCDRLHANHNVSGYDQPVLPRYRSIEHTGMPESAQRRDFVRSALPYCGRQSHDRTEYGLSFQSTPPRSLLEEHCRLLHENRGACQAKRGAQRKGGELFEGEIPRGQIDENVRRTNDRSTARTGIELQIESIAAIGVPIGNKSAVQSAKWR